MTTFEKAFHVAYVLYHVSFQTAVQFADHVDEGADREPALLDLADHFEAWCSEDAVEAELADSATEAAFATMVVGV